MTRDDDASFALRMLELVMLSAVFLLPTFRLEA